VNLHHTQGMNPGLRLKGLLSKTPNLTDLLPGVTAASVVHGSKVGKVHSGLWGAPCSASCWLKSSSSMTMTMAALLHFCMLKVLCNRSCRPSATSRLMLQCYDSRRWLRMRG
jgi:hypothetical protein